MKTGSMPLEARRRLGSFPNRWRPATKQQQILGNELEAVLAEATNDLSEVYQSGAGPIGCQFPLAPCRAAIPRKVVRFCLDNGRLYPIPKVTRWGQSAILIISWSLPVFTHKQTVSEPRWTSHFGYVL